MRYTIVLVVPDSQVVRLPYSGPTSTSYFPGAYISTDWQIPNTLRNLTLGTRSRRYCRRFLFRTTEWVTPANKTISYRDLNSAKTPIINERTFAVINCGVRFCKLENHPVILFAGKEGPTDNTFVSIVVLKHLTV